MTFITKAFQITVLSLIGFLLVAPFLRPNNSQPPQHRSEAATLDGKERTEQQVSTEKSDKEAQSKQDTAIKTARATELMQDVSLSMEFLDGAEIDLKRGTFSSMGMEGVGAMLEVIYSTATSLQAAWLARDILSAADIAHLKSAEARISAFQRKALPQLRLAFKKQVAATLWEHDVAIKLTGAGNTKLTFIGYWFAANANIKEVHDQLLDLLIRLRFKQVEYVTDAFTYTGAGYNLKTPADNVIAAYADGFTKIDHGQVKP